MGASKFCWKILRRKQQQPTRSQMLWGLILVLVPSQYMQIIKVEARRHGLDPLFVAAVIHQESRFNRYACFRGSHGLMQIQLRPRSCKGSEDQARSEGLYDPKTNIKRGVRLLSWWRSWWKKHPMKHQFHWLLFYNQGFGRCPRGMHGCSKRERVPIRSGKIGGYARRVLKIYEELKKKYRR
jgi:hypothetical protein